MLAGPWFSFRHLAPHRGRSLLRRTLGRFDRCSEDAVTTVHTFGHGTLSTEAFVTLLADAHVDRLVDVRSFPGAATTRNSVASRWSVGCLPRGSATSGCRRWAADDD